MIVTFFKSAYYLEMHTVRSALCAKKNYMISGTCKNVRQV